MPPTRQPEQQQQRSLSEHGGAREWIDHHLQAASAHAEEVGDKEVQELIEQLIRSLRQGYAVPKS